MGNILPNVDDANWVNIQYFDPTRAFAICSYLFFIGFLFAMSNLANRYLLKNRLQKMMEVNTLFDGSGRGSTRAVVWTIGLSFLLRSVWCLMKSFPNEYLACPHKARQLGVPAPQNATSFGYLQYNIRETINRSSTMLYFTSFSIIAMFLNRCCVSVTTAAIAAKQNKEMVNESAADLFQDSPTFPSSSSVSGQLSSGDFVAEQSLRHRGSINQRNEQNSNENQKPRLKTPLTCSQGLFVTLNLWLYIIFIVFMLVTWFDPTLNDACHPPRLSNGTECGTGCMMDWFPLPFEKRVCKPTWYFVHEFEIFMVNILFGILMLGVVIYGIKLFLIVCKLQRQNPNITLRLIATRILSIVIVCLVGFSARIVLFSWTLFGLPPWEGLACSVLRPYAQYLVTELVPGIVLIIFMFPDCHSIGSMPTLSRLDRCEVGSGSKEKEDARLLELQSSARSSLVIRPLSSDLTTYGSSTEAKGDTDTEKCSAEWLAGVSV